MEVHFLQIYYATINCILFGEAGNRYGLSLMSFVVCFDTYVGGGDQH